MTGSIKASTVGALVAAFLTSTASVALAKSINVDPGRSAVVQALSDCRKLTDDAARLACYDKAAGAFDQAESKGQVVVIDREQVKEVRRQAFGFNLPTLHIFDRGGAKPEDVVDHLDLEIDSAGHNAQGRWVFTASNGAVWRLTDDQEFASDPHKGSKLLVKNGALGGYFCKVDGQPQARCVRVS